METKSGSRQDQHHSDDLLEKCQSAKPEIINRSSASDSDRPRVKARQTITICIALSTSSSPILHLYLLTPLRQAFAPAH